MSDWTPHWIWMAGDWVPTANPFTLDWPEEWEDTRSADGPAEGLPIRHMMTWYGDQFYASRYARWRVLSKIPAGQPGALTHWQHGELVSFRIALLEDLKRRLCAGELVAKGFRPGSLELSDIPPEWWHGARIDVEESAAESHGLRLTGILIFPAARAAQNPTPKSDKSNAKKKTQEEVDAFVLALYEDARGRGIRPPKQKTDIFPMCSKFGATSRQTVKALRRVPTDLKRIRGERDFK